VGPRDGLDAVKKRKSPSHCRDPKSRSSSPLANRYNTTLQFKQGHKNFHSFTNEPFATTKNYYLCIGNTNINQCVPKYKSIENSQCELDIEAGIAQWYSAGIQAG
jgi:hypothetical protein